MEKNTPNPDPCIDCESAILNCGNFPCDKKKSYNEKMPDGLPQGTEGESRKYIMTDETASVDGHLLHRIQAVRNFGTVQEGQLGGFIENEGSLSHDGNCWVHRNAKVYGNAHVLEDAWISRNACIFGKATVKGNAWVTGNASVSSASTVSGNAKVEGNAVVCDRARIYGHAKISDNAFVSGSALIYDDAVVFDCADIWGDAVICGSSAVCDKAHVFDSARVDGTAIVCGNAEISGDAVVSNGSDYIVFKNWWSSGRYFTWTRSNGMWRVGCFHGTGEELVKKAYKDSLEKGQEYKRIVEYVEGVEKRTVSLPIQTSNNMEDCFPLTKQQK